MKALAGLLLVILTLTACDNTSRFVDCIDGCSNFQDGRNGRNGNDGNDGVDGIDGTDGVDGADGQDGVDGTNGADGQDGTDGADGSDGSNGHSSKITVTPIPVGPATMCAAANGGYFYESFLDMDDDGVLDPSESLLPSYNGVALCNGANGADGQNSPPTSYTVTEVIDPCGVQGSMSSPDELFLRMANGMLVVSFSQNSAGNMTRFSNLVPPSNGTFNGSTTDSTSCAVSITRSGNNVTLTSSPSGPIGVWSWVVNY